MRELRLIGVHDDGEHLLLTEDGEDRLTVPIDDALRSAVRRAMPVPSADVDSVPVPEELRPRDVQALLRAGASVADVAERAGWTAEKVRRYEGPIRAERDHIAGLARAIAVTSGGGRGETTFGERAERRLDGRGVDPEAVIWDSWRGRDGDWTVLCSFPAGGRPRRATWHFDVRSRTLEPTDDEARWLGEDENSPSPLASARETSVYDVEAEGGLNAARSPQVRRVRGGRTSATAVPKQPEPTTGTKPSSAEPSKDSTETGERPVDLVAAMRERSKNRRRKGRAATTAQQDFPEDAAPREQLDTSGEAPPVGSHPREDELADVEAAAGEAAAGDTDRTAADENTTPSVEHLGHDPVTGTADLFADLHTEESAKESTEESAAESTAKPGASEDTTEDTTKDTTKDVGDDSEVSDEGTDEGTNESSDESSDSDDASEVTNESEESEGSEGSDDPEDATDVPADDKPAERAAPRDAGTVVPDRPSSARKGRPSVPSWDDIMFGRRPGRD